MYEESLVLNLLFKTLYLFQSHIFGDSRIISGKFLLLIHMFHITHRLPLVYWVPHHWLLFWLTFSFLLLQNICQHRSFNCHTNKVGLRLTVNIEVIMYIWLKMSTYIRILQSCKTAKNVFLS